MNPSETKDLYARLGIDSSASEEKIKSAYRQMALKWYPDRNPDKEEATRHFVAVSEAYEVLSNPVKKVKYDSEHQILSFLNEVGDWKKAEEYYVRTFSKEIDENTRVFYKETKEGNKGMIVFGIKKRSMNLNDLEKRLRESGADEQMIKEIVERQKKLFEQDF